MTDGLLIALEGIDGSGKSTTTDNIDPEDINWNGNITFTTEPTHSGIGELIQEGLKNEDLDPMAELFLFMADHYDHYHRVIKPALENGDLVITDRYIDSRCAYQATTLQDRLDNPLNFILDLHEPWSKLPDKTLYFMIEPQESLNRINPEDKFEKYEQLMKIDANYMRLLSRHPHRFEFIDADQSPETVTEETVQEINRIIQNTFDGYTTSSPA